MGTLVNLAEHRRRRAGGDAPDPVAATPAAGAAAPARPTRVEFAFDLGDPLTYLAAERVDRSFAEVVWVPVLGVPAGLPPASVDEVEARAAALRMPVMWPEHPGPWEERVRPAMRLAALAAEHGRAAAFVLAAGRLAYGGGFALDDPEVLVEAIGAAGLPFAAALEAAGDAGRDAPLEATARALRDLGADRLPVLRVGETLFAGEDRLPEAVHAARGAVPAVRCG